MYNPFHQTEVPLIFCSHFPLTHLQEWTGTFFQKHDLQNIGQKIQLGHAAGDVCSSPQQSTHLFTIIHTNGIHVVNIWFCSYILALHHGDCVQQLLRCCIFPATMTDPQTGSISVLLKLAHILSVQSKLSLYNFYISIKTLTDTTHISNIKVCVGTMIHYCCSPLTSTEGLLPRISLDD